MPSIYRSAAGRTTIRDWCDARLDAWPVPHELPELTAHGARTHAVVTPGRGTGPATVFVPGTNFNAATSLPLLGALAGLSDGPVIALDIPGQPGLSDDDRSLGAKGPGGPGGPAWYGPWLADAVRQLTEGPVVLAGHSFGGAIVMAADVPTATRRVLVSTGGLCRLRLPAGLLFGSMVWLLHPSTSSSARLLRAMHGPGIEPDAELVEWMTLVARHANSSGSPWVTAPAAGLPTTVATGEHDIFLPPERLGPAVRAQLEVELDVIPGAGHLVVDEQPARIAELIVGR